MTLKTLLIEDSPTQGEYYKTILEDMGIEVTWVADGHTALNAAFDLPFDVIILDLNLPDMDGIQLCIRLKRAKETYQIPVIMLTQRDHAQDAMNGLKAGAIDYIAKDDFAAETLAASLSQLGIF